jgi:hypothetical protein
MSARWLVERKADDFEDVGAEYVKIVDGCLMFSDNIFESPTYIIAAGQWLTVCEAAE